MLHNTTRENLLQVGKGYTALVADALYAAGFQPYDTFTAEIAINALQKYGTSPKVVRIGLLHPLFSPRGRRHRVFTMPAPSTARKLVNGSDKPFRDELPASAYKSLPDYRRALHHALIRRRPGLYKRIVLAKRLGVCKRTTANYDRRLGHAVTAQSVAVPLTPAVIADLPTQKNRTGRRDTWLVQMDEAGVILKHAPPVRAIALKWLKLGFNIGLQKQTANHYAPSKVSPYTTGEYSQYIMS